MEEREIITSESLEEIDEEIERVNFRKVEAALFLAGRFMTLKELVTLTDVNPILLRKLLGDLKDKYAGSGINIINEGNVWKMDVSQDHVELVNRLATGSAEFTNAEQETLAIIAYKQPIKQSVVVKIRGNKAYDHIKSFVDLGLVSKKRMGHTSELTLRDKFNEYFHKGERA